MILIFFLSFEHVRMPFSQCFNNHHEIDGKTMEWIKRHTNSKRSWMWKRGKKVRWKEGHKENKKLRKCQWKTSIRQKEQWHEWEKTDVRLCEAISLFGILALRKPKKVATNRFAYESTNVRAIRNIQSIIVCDNGFSTKCHCTSQHRHYKVKRSVCVYTCF